MLWTPAQTVCVHTVLTQRDRLTAAAFSYDHTCIINYFSFACFYTLDLCMGICRLQVFLSAVKRFEPPEALYKFPVIINDWLLGI